MSNSRRVPTLTPLWIAHSGLAGSILLMPIKPVFENKAVTVQVLPVGTGTGEKTLIGPANAGRSPFAKITQAVEVSFQSPP